MTKFIFTLIVALGFTFSASAAQIQVEVQGMVCSFCTQGIAKNFSKNAAVKKVDVNFKEAKVTIALRKNHDLSDSDIQEILLDSGFHAGKITRE